MHRIDRYDFPSTACTYFLGVCCLILGCGGGGTPEPVTGGSHAAVSSQSAGSSSANPIVPQQTMSEAAQVDPNRKETKWIGKIPYDVFYDQPLTVAADSTVIGEAVPTSPGTPVEATPAMSPGTPTETSSAATGTATATVNWAEILPMPILLEELKTIRTRLTTNLQTVATYNKSAEAIALDGSIVAALGAITTVHPEADTWKDRGKLIRDLGFAIYSSSGEVGRTAYQSTEEPFLKLQTAMDGGAVDGLAAEEFVPFSDVAYVSEMMKRIETTFNNLKSNINTEARMKESPELVLRDLHMLTALGTLMGTESYDNADVKLYQTYVSAFVGGARKSLESVKTENYEGFREGLNEIQTTCAECHQHYRGSDTGF